jgi:hypothetical protein
VSGGFGSIMSFGSSLAKGVKEGVEDIKALDLDTIKDKVENTIA